MPSILFLHELEIVTIGRKSAFFDEFCVRADSFNAALGKTHYHIRTDDGRQAVRD